MSLVAVIILAFIIVAGVLAIIELFRSKWQSLSNWAILALAVALVIWRVQ